MRTYEELERMATEALERGNFRFTDGVVAGHLAEEQCPDRGILLPRGITLKHRGIPGCSYFLCPNFILQERFIGQLEERSKKLNQSSEAVPGILELAHWLGLPLKLEMEERDRRLILTAEIGGKLWRIPRRGSMYFEVASLLISWDLQRMRTNPGYPGLRGLDIPEPSLLRG